MEGTEVKKRYNLSLVFFPQDDGGYCVECPELDGCFSDGATIEEATEAIQELIPEWLEAEITKNELHEEMFRLGSCLPGKVFKEIEVEAEITDTGEVVFPAADQSVSTQKAV
jgi:predicted RNase H-like HicB family nuclease